MFAIKHACSLQKVVRILLLMQKEACVAPDDLDAEEVVESPQVLEGELSAEPSCNLLQ